VTQVAVVVPVRSVARALTSPVLPLALLASAGVALLATAHTGAALAVAAAVAGVALSGST
jgi:hypothetical protein